MTTVQITLPDDLVEKATRSGLLSSARLEVVLRAQLRVEAAEGLRELRERLEANPISPMSDEEIQVEIDAARAEMRRAVGH